MPPSSDPGPGGSLPDPLRGATSRSEDPASGAALGLVARLLGDGSATVRGELRRRFEAAGKAGRAHLRRASASSDARVRAHARTLLMEAERRVALRRLARYASAGRLDLETGLFLLGRLHTPRLDPRPYRRALDAMGRKVRGRAAARAGGLERARALVDYLGGELDFRGDGDDYHHPDNVHLHRAIERKRGLPLTLVALYLAVARRAGIEASAIPLPGHVMLRLRGGRRDLIVDPFHGGAARSQEALMGYLALHGLSFRPEWFRDAPDAALLQRQSGNLARSFEQRGLKREARALLGIAELFGRRAREGRR